MAVRLTDRLIEKHPHPKSGQVFAWDDLVSGFGVRFTPTPKRAAYIVQWRERGDIKRRETIAHWPRRGVAEARELARKRLAEVAATADTGGAVRLRDAMRTWYERQTEMGTWRPRYRAKVDSIIATYIEANDNTRVKLSPAARVAVDALGKKSVASVTRTDVMRVADAIKPGTAEQVMAILSSFFNAMYEREIVTANPARNRLRVTGGRRIRRRKLSDAEFLTLFQAIKGEGDPALGAFALLALTGARRREVTQMRWAEVNLDAATWTLPPERRKTGKKDPEPFVVHLHAAAVEIIRRQPVLENSPFVFWGRRDKKPFDFHYALAQRLRGAKVEDWRLHDLRRYMRSGMGQLGVTQTVAEMCLGHRAKSALVDVYDQHDYYDEKRDAWQRWGDYLAGLTGGAL